MNRNQILDILRTRNSEDLNRIFKEAYQVKLDHVGAKVFLRGIIEFSNICEKDCYYCGIRKSASEAERFLMSEEEVESCARFAHKNNYGSIVLQAGERSGEQFTRLVEKFLVRIKKATGGELGVTLSLGEQSEETLLRWFEAGAHRYLLRIETSNKDLYRKLHPGRHEYDVRLDCLNILRRIGYQVGTGVMIGLPYQTCEDLADDILFFKDQDMDMIGMGPYIVHEGTPLSKVSSPPAEMNFILGLKMIAAVRLCLRDVNIASTTALQALDPEGREKGLLAGANVIMPNLTPLKYRQAYKLYEGKPCVKDSADECRTCLEKRVQKVGEKIGYGQWGDSPHFMKRMSSEK